MDNNIPNPEFPFSPQAVNPMDDSAQYQQLEEILRQERERQAALIALQQEIAHTYHDLQTIMQLIIQHSQQMTQASGGVVELAEGEDMVYRAASGTAAPHVGMRLKRAGSLSGRCIQERAVLICEDAETDPRVDRNACRRIGVRSMIVAPLQHDGQSIGVIKVFSPQPRAFGSWDVTTLQLMAGMMSVVLRDAESLRSLQESEERFRSLVDNIPLIIWMANAEGKPVFMNRYWEEFTGRTREEAAEATPRDDFHPDDRDAFLEHWQECVVAHKPFQFEYRRRYRDGQFHWMNAHAAPRFLPDGSFLGYIGFSMDVHQEKTLQTHLFEAQKMESLGRLAGGIAHDFNNLLTAILGYTNLAASSLPAEAEEQKHLDNVMTAAERAAGLTKQLLMYSRRQMVEFRDVDINQVVRDALKILPQTLGEQCELVSHLTQAECFAHTNAGQIEQVLINLAVNARDAMPTGGRILIETATVTLDKTYVASHFSVKPGEYVMLSVSDTGMGMTEEVKQRIFEPFFTTKEVGKGTGLGLATSYGIIKQSKGSIWVYSEIGQGTTFKVYLPRVRDAVRTAAASSAPGTLAHGSATVLLVDDEPLVRDLAARILREHGYHVLEARNGADALQIQSEYKDDIDLLITDVVMPLMGGRELEGRMQRLRPKLKTLYLSGYTHNVVVEEGVLKSDVTLLIKPFTKNDLLEKVQEALQ